ncbi:SDR family oxidoreductase [Thermococcus celer]|uniref:Alcohol dehydrogenase n=1 Tax=Thermococcus celer Vu 13 = JCM 8558 TaxID=1293037 RepID=A0A218P163_THECE|nr:SDR family oxidoreductase [Thermococcus celer]ASI98676.1 alcohol dehydrogenase [Thermococcus celer Vu 13 = JCM 8558]
MKVAVVTGASRGIGEAIARALAEEGYALAIGARSVERLKKLAEELGGEVFYHHLDVSRPESVEEFANKTIERFGKVDVVVANAGLGYFGRLEELGEEEFHEMIEVNLLGMWRTIKAFLRNLKETNGVVVAVTSDVSARLLPYGGGYTATKWAARALVKTFQIENPDVRFFELRPGAVDTYFGGSKPGKPKEKGFLKPEEVAEAVKYLLRLPKDVRVEELMLRSMYQKPEY